ncbi:MAG: HEAT repeat domain-containing protein [Methylobacter sp.]|nr:HEAT repeat domain-containing protein [Methylobacter sp.]
MPNLQNVRQKNLKGEDLPPLPELTLDPNGLPSGFTPSREPPVWMTTDDEAPVHRFEELPAKEQKQVLSRVTAIRQAGAFANDDERKLIEEYVEFKLSQLTRKGNRLGGKTPAHELQDKFFREINPLNLAKTDKTEVRVFMATKVVGLAPQFLNNYHLVPRVQTAILLARLSELVEVQGNGPQAPPVQFTKALPELLALLKQDKANTPAGVRAWGIAGAVKLYNVQNLKIGERSKIVETLVEQINKSGDEPWWNQWRMVEAMGQIRVTSLADKKPIVAQALARVLIDESRDWLVRSEAATALGQLNYETGTDLGLIAYEVGQMARQMTDAYLKDPTNRRWKLCYIKVYGAFKPTDANGTGTGLLKQAQDRAALAAYRNPIGAVFDKVLPLVAGVVKKADTVATTQEELAKFLTDNPPKVDRIHSAEEPLHAKQPLGASQQPPVPPAGG